MSGGPDPASFLSVPYLLDRCLPTIPLDRPTSLALTAGALGVGFTFVYRWWRLSYNRGASLDQSLAASEWTGAMDQSVLLEGVRFQNVRV
jgi:hypothetical protein